MIYIVSELRGCIGDENEQVRGVYDTREAAEDRQAELTEEISSIGDHVIHSRGEYPYRSIIYIDEYALNAPRGED